MKIKDILERGIEFEGIPSTSDIPYTFSICPDCSNDKMFFLYGDNEFEGQRLRVMNMLEIALSLTVPSAIHGIVVTVEDPIVAGIYCNLKIGVLSFHLKLIDSE